MTPKHTKQNRGFTLLEIVVSITLLALIAMMMVRVFNESSKTIGRGQDDALLEASARMLFDYMEQDISQALIRTNIIFRVDPESFNGTLCFVSPAARKLHPLIGRDTAPMRFRTQPAAGGNLPEYNRNLIEEAPDRSSVKGAVTIQNLILSSDYYGGSQPCSPGLDEDADIYTATYVQSLSDRLEDHAVLTFIEFKINGNSEYNEALTSPENAPRFIDISLGLIASSQLQIALLKNAPEQIAKYERLYSRRIQLINRPAELISF